MILEDPYVGLIVLLALIALVGVGRLAVPARQVSAFEPVLDSLRDVDDDELVAIGAELRRLPSKSVPQQAVLPMMRALQDWRATFDNRARQRFVDLAKSQLAQYADHGATPRPS